MLVQLAIDFAACDRRFQKSWKRPLSLQRRRAMMASALARVQCMLIATETEMQEKKARVESALLTTEALVAEIPEEKKEPAMPPGGMDGMGGMGGMY